jgi:anti-sigma factor RsiW
MSIDDTVLMAYVDGELSAERRAEVEAAVAHSRELADRLAAMRASALPYGAAFARQALPPVPEALTRRVAELTRSSANAPPQLQRRTWPRLAAAFLVGALVAGSALQLSRHDSASMELTAAATPWVKAVADYQVLYTRETVASVNEDHALSEKIIGELQSADHLEVAIPDLRGAGLTFKRVQRLSYNNQAVVQIVYLPEKGGPVALCLTRDGRADEAPRSQEIGGMHTVAWRHNQVGYVLLAKDAQVDLAELGKSIAGGAMAHLYGWVDTRQGRRLLPG